MTDLSSILTKTRRPRLLIQAARRGLALYKPERDLRGLLGTEERGTGLAARLLAAEQAIEETRQAGDATYSIARHITLLTALMAEARAPANA